jgi:hypothetical protein
MKILNIVVASLIIILMLSCHKLKYGTIIEKWHEPQRSYMVLIPYRINKLTMLIPYRFYDNEDWCIKVKGRNDENRIFIKTFYITKESYDTMTVGKFICIDDDCDTDNNNTQVKQ